MVSPQPKLPSSCPKLPSSLNEATVVRYLGQTCLPSSRGDSFGDYCTKTRKGTSLSFWCKVYNASVFLCSKFERDRWSQRDASRQKLLEASGRVGAILTTVASRGCPQWYTHDTVINTEAVDGCASETPKHQQLKSCERNNVYHNASFAARHDFSYWFQHVPATLNGTRIDMIGHEPCLSAWCFLTQCGLVTPCEDITHSSGSTLA